MPQAHAVTTNWTNNAGGFFNSSGNWDNGVPGADDLAVFRRGNIAPYTVTFHNPSPPPIGSPIHPTINRLIVGTNTVTFSGLLGSTLTVDEFALIGGTTIIGQTASDMAVLNSQLASFDTLYATLGNAAGSSGTLNLTALPGGTFNVTGDDGNPTTYELIVGASGAGTINVASGRDVTVAGNAVLGQSGTGEGILSIGGSGSSWSNTGELVVGNLGQGMVSITPGGALSTTSAVIGEGAGSVGEVTVDGAGSTWLTNNLEVGNAGAGTLNIRSGGVVKRSDTGTQGIDAAIVGVATGSNGTINIEGGSLYIKHVLAVGGDGIGVVNISSGGIVCEHTAASYIGGGTGSGEVHVDGGGQWLNDGDLFVENGSLSISAGAVTANQFYIWGGDNSPGTVVVDGPMSQISFNDLFVGSGIDSSATLEILNGARIELPAFGSSIVVNTNGSMLVQGTDVTSASAVEQMIVNGSLNVAAGGAVTTTTASLGTVSTASAVATVDGNESMWTNVGNMEVGTVGMATLTIQNGGTVEVGGNLNINALSKIDLAGGTLRVGSFSGFDNLNWTSGTLHFSNTLTAFPATFPVIGSNRSLLASQAIVGSDDALIVDGGSAEFTDGMFVEGFGGRVEIRSGGTLSTPWATVSGSITMPASILVDGAESTWLITGESGDLWLSNLGDPISSSRLEITNGGRVENPDAYVARDAATFVTVIVDGMDSTWLTHGQLLIGHNQGRITMNITNGGQVVSEYSHVEPGGYGEITVSGESSMWMTNTTMRIDPPPLGQSTTLNILDGGSVRSNHAIVSGAEVTIDGANSRWIVDGGLGILFAGKLKLSNGGAVETPLFDVASNGDVRGTGDIYGNLENGGAIHPGMSIGVIHVDGDYTQTSAGELVIEIMSAESFDRLEVTGEMMLAGLLDVDLLNSYTPPLGAEFDILDFATLDGVFTNVELPPLPAPRAWDTSRLYTDGILAVTGPAAGFGDYNDNGTVDAADYVVWKKSQLGSLVTPYTGADGNGNGVIDLDDYNVWRAHFGETVGGGAGSTEMSSAAVPEPVAWVQILTGILAMFCGRRGVS